MLDKVHEKREPSDTVGGNINQCSHYEKQYGGSLKAKNRELPYDPAIPLLGHVSRQNHNSKRYMQPKTLCSTIYNSQDMEIT